MKPMSSLCSKPSAAFELSMRNQLRGPMKTPNLYLLSIPIGLLLLALSGSEVRAQQEGSSQRENRASRTRAVNESVSRAEREAERLVSLAPEKIILLLSQEPGLFLEIKKMLVRNAYGQGQVLDPKELTDEAVFRLVRDDEDTRALITQQIVDRGYIRAKPTREELAREFEEQQRLARTNPYGDDQDQYSRISS